MTELRRSAGMAALALQFTILTTARSGEVRGATWDEIDLPERLWTIPACRMKANKGHRVPLSDAALEILAALPYRTGVLFPGMKQKSLSNMRLTPVLRSMGRDNITVHGFRSSFRDWCVEGEGNNFTREVCEHALAHSLPDRVEAAYRRSGQPDQS